MDVKKNRIVIYTAVFGGYSDILPQKKISNTDFVCFTDNANKLKKRENKPWKIQEIKMPVKNDPVRSNRYIKHHPHILFPDYEISIYIDSNFFVIGDIHKLIKTSLKNYNFACFDHNQCIDARNCAYEEFEALAKFDEQGLKKGNIQIMRKQMEAFKAEGFPKNYGLIFAAVLIRKHLEKDVIQLQTRWWDIVSNKSKRDQLCFNYICWKLSFEPFVIAGDLRRGNPYFFWIGEHRKNFDKKIITYRIKKFFGIYH